MLAAKRPVSLPVSGESDQNKRSKAVNDTATSTSISPSIGSSSADAHDARELLHPEQHKRVTVYTQFSENSFFRGLPNLSADARCHTWRSSQSTLRLRAAPSILPTKVPFHLKQVFSECNRAAKIAWISETGLAEFPDEDLSDEHLNNLYKVACRKLARRQSNPQASATTTSNSSPANRTLPSDHYVIRLDR